MKNKVKFRSLVEIYRALSITEDDLAKNIQTSNSHASPALEQFKGTTSQMDGRGTDVPTEASIKRMPISAHRNHIGSNSICSVFSENVNGEVPTSASIISQHNEMLKVDALGTKKSQKVNDLGCGGDNTSCISKADGTNLGSSGHLTDNDQKNFAGSSNSVTSFCQEGPEKPVDVQSINHGCASSECIVEGGNKFRGSSEYPREALQSAADISDRSDPSETSSLRDEQGVLSPKVGSVSPARGTDFLKTPKSDAEIDSNEACTVVLNKLDQKQHLEMRMANDMQEPSLQYRDIPDNEDSDELILIDIGICDICGGTGRQALLAFCSKCSDGAEHIYCMRIKMDKVPEGDWMCEDCTVLAVTQKQKADEQKIGKALQKSSTGEVAQNLRKSDLSGDNGRIRMGHDSLAPSRKRPGLNIDVRSSSKRRALDNDVKLSSPRSFLKTGSPRHPNLKISTKGETASPSGRSYTQNVLRKAPEISPGRSSKFESHFRKGSVTKQKLENCTDLRRERTSEDAHREPKTLKGSVIHVAEQRHDLTKLTKSKSFTTSSSARMDRNNSKKNMDSEFKIPKVGSKRSISQRSYSFNSKVSQLASPNGSSSISIVKPAKATPAPVEVKHRVVQNGHPIAKTSEVRKELERASIHCVPKRKCDSNGFDRKIASSLADKGRSSGPSGTIKSVSISQKADRNAANLEEEHKLKEARHQLNDKDKVRCNGLPSGATVSLAASAHPDVDYVWRGMFNLECTKLPICCSGLQAHLSTSASPKAFEVASKLPGEITVKEVLQQDIWPSQFRGNHVTENDIALYFFAEDNESYRRYKRFLNCMMLNDLALIANLDGIELLIFHSQVLPAASRRWNNLFFLWGVFRAKRSSYSEEVCVPSPKEDIQIPVLEQLSKPLAFTTQLDPGLSAAEAVSVSVLGSGFSSQNELLQSSVSARFNCEEDISVKEAGCKTLEKLLVVKEQHSGELQSTDEGQEESTSPDQDPTVKPVDEIVPSEPVAEISAEPTTDINTTTDLPLLTEEKHQGETALTYPPNTARLSTIDVNVPISLSPSNSQDKHHHHHHHHRDFNLELPLLSESEQFNVNGDNPDVVENGFVSLDLSLALPSMEMEDPLPEMDDDGVDTSLCLFFGGKKA